MAYNEISWRITSSLDTLCIGYDKCDNRIPVPQKILDMKLEIKEGDRVALAYCDDVPMITVPIHGNTVYDFFKSIYDGVHQKLEKNTLNDVTIPCIISKFLDTKRILELTKLYNNNLLTPYDLIYNNYDFFDGNIQRMSNGVWEFAIGD